jgi:hypothetical protein
VGTPLPLAGFQIPVGHATLDFFRGNILDVGANRPSESKWIACHRAAFTPCCVLIGDPFLDFLLWHFAESQAECHISQAEI